MQSFHTRVGGLEDDPDCAGDIVGDQLLEHYFDSLFDRDSANRAPAIKALIDLARQSACLGEQQSSLLSSLLVHSYAELESFLRLNGLDRALPYVSQATAQPLLFFYDVEKYRGSSFPLARWFEDHREALLEGTKSRRNPIFWHGL